MASLSAGSLLGGCWRVESLIGEGACAKVYSVKGNFARSVVLMTMMMLKIISLITWYQKRFAS